MNNDLNWRYATKKFDSSRKIPKQQLEEVLEALRLSPSSCGLQPWKFLVIQNPELRNKLKPHAWNQPQITDADTLIVLCAIKGMDENYIKRFVDQISRTQGMSRESLAGHEQMMLGLFRSKSPEALSQWMKEQVYLALGFFLAECSQRKIDACPMEGFVPHEFDEVLGLSKEGLESVVLCAIGYRASDDQHAGQKKVRFDKNEVFIHRS